MKRKGEEATTQVRAAGRFDGGSRGGAAAEQRRRPASNWKGGCDCREEVEASGPDREEEERWRAAATPGRLAAEQDGEALAALQ